MSGRDNFSQLFNDGSGNMAVSATNEGTSHPTQNDAPLMQGDEFNELEEQIKRQEASEIEDNTTSDEVIDWNNDGREKNTNSEELVVNWNDSTSSNTTSNTLPQSTTTATANNNISISNNNTPTSSTSTTAGTETIQHLRSFGSSIFGSTINKIKPLRDVNISQKLAAATNSIDKIQDKIESRFNERQADKALAAQLDSMNANIAKEQSKKDAEREQNELEREIKSRFGSADSDNHPANTHVEEDNDEHIDLQADTTSYMQGWKYDALLKFTSSAPTGSYEEFIEFLLMGGWRSSESTHYVM